MLSSLLFGSPDLVKLLDFRRIYIAKHERCVNGYKCAKNKAGRPERDTMQCR